MVACQVALVIGLAAMLAPVAAAQAPRFDVVDLPANSLPLAIAADEDGTLWLTLVGAWSFAHSDPGSGALETFPLTVGPTQDREELFDILIDSRGDVWTASNTHAFRLAPDSGEVTAFELPSETALSGGLAETSDGIVVAQVTANKLAVLDPAQGSTQTEIEISTIPTGDGPLKLISGPDGSLVGSATYADGLFVVDGDDVSTRAAGLLRGPVGLALDGSTVWAAEMGGSSVARVGLDDSSIVRFPTTPSHYYELSGPAGIAVADDGIVWFVEHFADRVVLLDTERGVLEEVQVPGAPGTNVQFLAISEGRVWFPLMTANKLVSLELRAPAEPPFTLSDDAFEVEAGRAFDLTIEPGPGLAGGDMVAAPNREEFSFEPGAAGALAVTVQDGTPAGTYRFIVSYDTTDLALGRYVTVTVAEADAAPSDSPSIGLVALVLLATVAALMRRR